MEGRWPMGCTKMDRDNLRCPGSCEQELRNEKSPGMLEGH